VKGSAHSMKPWVHLYDGGCTFMDFKTETATIKLGRAGTFFLHNSDSIRLTVSKSWANVHFCVNYPFKSVPGCVYSSESVFWIECTQ